VTGNSSGRLIIAFHEYLSHNFKPGLPVEQEVALRACFFSGMQALLTRLHPESIQEVEYHDWQLLEEFRREMTAIENREACP
jgi:hypothetical protein